MLESIQDNCEIPAKKTEPLSKRKTTFVDSFSEEVFNQTYRYVNDHDINDRHRAVAINIAGAELPERRAFWAEEFLGLLEDFKFVPGGRITSNAGTALKGTTYINCFVSGFQGPDQDSMSSIMDELKRQALILKSEGGYGFCANVMRPRGAFVSGIGGDSPGAVKLLEMWDTQSAVITAGSGQLKAQQKGKTKIRKGAQMVTMSIWHPDIEEYVRAKQTAGRLTKFNMSVLIPDAFMQAVKDHASWKLEFPDIESEPEAYRTEWSGDLTEWKRKGYKTKVYKEYGDANELWDLIMRSTYERNEPGVLFHDTINKWNNLYYSEKIFATNPCGEQALPVGGVCLLGSLNLTQFVNKTQSDWDYEQLAKYIPVAVRFMDNVNDITQVPLPENRENLKNKRRIGLGIMGYGSALMMMKMRYGSAKALEVTDKLSKFIMNEAYRASALLAKEKGCFPMFDRAQYVAGRFVSRLDSDVLELVKEYGTRNSHLLSIQPTGNSSVLANNVSGGLEPIFSAEYTRTVSQPFALAGMILPTEINWQTKNFSIADKNQQWTWANEGDENILVTQFGGAVWKIDSHRGLLKESTVKDYAVRFLQERNAWDPSADWAATTMALNIRDHVNTMEVFAKYIDSAISKTVNLPNDYSYDDFKELYKYVYDTGTIKGCTSYRDGTMTAVLSLHSSLENKNKIQRTQALPRPKSLECSIHQIKTSGELWLVFVGLLGKDPYEVFAMKQKHLQLPATVVEGHLIKEKSGVYHLETRDGWFLKDIRKFFESDEQEALTRMISTALRHGADIEFIVQQLQKSEGTINSFSKAIARTLQNYISEPKHARCLDCQSRNVKLQEGCYVCMDCGSSKCS